MGENGAKYSFFTVPFPPFSGPQSHSPEIEDLPHSSPCKNQPTTLTDGKMEFFAIYIRSLPWRLVQMIANAI